jgi:hypothetical protein
VPRPGAPDGGPNYYPVPTLDLSDTPVAVYYDATLTALPASYISVFYPALLAIGQITWQVDPGALPPLWGVPEDARNSALVKKINVRAGDGSLAWPGAPLHPEDMGAAYGLSDDERQTIIRSIDLGGQYWCRQNTSFHSFPSDPLGSSSALP